MRVYTIQAEGAYHHLLRYGTLYGDPQRVDLDYREAYAWMTQRLAERQGYASPGLLWVWVHPKPDLRRMGHLEPHTRGVRLELEVDPDRVLQSAFDPWCFVLGQHYVPTSDADWDNPNQIRVEKSWFRVFDLPLMRQGFGGQDMWVQGVLSEIRSTDIVRATSFEAR